MFCLMEQEKKLFLLQHYFLYVVYDGASEKTHFVKKLFFFMLSMMEEEKRVIVLEHFFLYVVYDGAKEKTNSLITLVFLCCL